MNGSLVTKLDPGTTLVFAFVTLLAIGILLTILARTRASVLDGASHLAAAVLLFASLPVVAFVSPFVPAVLLNPVFGMLLTGALLLLYDGMGRLKQWRVDRWWYLPLLLFIGVGYVVFTDFVPSFGGRVLVSAVVNMSLIAALVIRLVPSGTQEPLRFGERVLVTSLFFLMAIALLRLTEVVFSGAFQSTGSLLQQSSAVRIIFMAGGMVAVILVALSLFLTLQDYMLKRLEHDAAHDPLTGVLTRRVVLTVLERLLAKLHRTGAQVGVLVIDIDHFKRINDTYGHRAGDQVLISVTNAIRSVMRGDSFLGRLGGEEFVLIAPGTSQDDLTQLAERVRVGIQNWESLYRDRPIRVTASVGACLLTPENYAAIPDPVHAADSAMYRAKTKGRNRIEVTTTGE